MRLGVAGWPVAHSRSPAIQNAALRAVGMGDWRYQLLPIPPDLFEETVLALPGCGFRGLNVTIPHKQRALELAVRRDGAVSPRALAIGAVNTLVFEPGGAVTADNTDAPGLIAALGAPPAGMTALVLGAGGSARAVVWALLDAGAAEVMVWNRTPGRARELCLSLGGGTAVAQPRPADLLVNCTSVGLPDSGSASDGLPDSGSASDGLRGPGSGEDERAQLPIPPGALGYGTVVDLVYREGGTALLRRAREQGLRTVDGLEVLVEQGAISFEQFTGVECPRAVMRAAVGLPARATPLSSQR